MLFFRYQSIAGRPEYVTRIPYVPRELVPSEVLFACFRLEQPEVSSETYGGRVLYAHALAPLQLA